MRDQVFVVLTGRHNELLLDRNRRWRGAAWRKLEVVAVWKGTVAKPQHLPQGFTLAEAVVVSFERERVYAIDFATGSGCYFLRDAD